MLTGSLFRGSRFWVSALVSLPAGYWLYYFRMIGAGDLKTMALICGFMGTGDGLCAIGLGVCISAAVSLTAICICKASKKQFLDRLVYFSAWFRQIVQTKEKIIYYDPQRDEEVLTIPLGSYLCLGTICYAVWRSWKGVL